MANKSASKYHEMTDAELTAAYGSLKNELFNLRFQQTVGQLKSPMMIRTVKKDIARVMTVMNERKTGGAK